MKEQIDERLELSDIIDYAGRDWDNYIDECREEGNSPIDTFEEWIADAILGADYRKQIKGEWEIVKGSNCKEKMVCTNCRHQQDLASTFTYCPNCGAKMKGENK
jgi:hypothetical protein